MTYDAVQMKDKRLELRVTDDLMKRVDVARGDVSRTRWVERAIERALADSEAGWVRDEHGQVVGQKPKPLPKIAPRRWAN